MATPMMIPNASYCCMAALEVAAGLGMNKPTPPCASEGAGAGMNKLSDAVSKALSTAVVMVSRNKPPTSIPASLTVRPRASKFWKPTWKRRPRSRPTLKLASAQSWMRPASCASTHLERAGSVWPASLLCMASPWWIQILPGWRLLSGATEARSAWSRMGFLQAGRQRCESARMCDPSVQSRPERPSAARARMRTSSSAPAAAAASTAASARTSSASAPSPSVSSSSWSDVIASSSTYGMALARRVLSWITSMERSTTPKPSMPQTLAEAWRRSFGNSAIRPVSLITAVMCVDVRSSCCTSRLAAARMRNLASSWSSDTRHDVMASCAWQTRFRCTVGTEPPNGGFPEAAWNTEAMRRSGSGHRWRMAVAMPMSQDSCWSKSAGGHTARVAMPCLPALTDAEGGGSVCE
mmetsp:Transcript_17940/g.67644  ORF Transcript_17940/g.67644 Transcript_17940/m.67644 type:complete len:409 (-) Transcript_17940:5488-6714(-)